MLKNKKLPLAIAVSMVIFTVTGIAVSKYLQVKKQSNYVQVAKPLSHAEFDSIKSELTQLLVEEDPKASFDHLRVAMEGNVAIARECHPLLHHIGHAAYAKYKDFNVTVNYQDGLCNSGYTHGTIEAHFMASPDVQTALQTTCKADNNDMSFELKQCYHGMGHGLMYVTGKDLPQSLSLCENLPNTFARSSCVNGAFMERFIIVSHTGAPAKSTEEVNTKLCEGQSESYKTDCYIYAPTAFLERNTNDYKGAFKDCKSVEKSHIASCMHGVGSQAVKENITKPELAREICQQAPQGYVNACIGGIVGLLINHHASSAPVRPLCSSIFAKYEAVCANKVSAWDTKFGT